MIWDFEYPTAVTVRDAGTGFDTAATPLDKLGIRTSIVAQLEQVGGRAEVLSEHGSGTQVRLTWELDDGPDPRLDVPLGWAVFAAGGMTAVGAVRAWLSLGPVHAGWVFTGFALVIVLTLLVSVWPRLTWVALSLWLVSGTVLAITAPPLGDLESQNWLAIGCAALFIAVARVRRERGGFWFAVATFLASLVISSWFRPQDVALGWAYWIQPVIYAGLAWLGITQFERLLRGYRDASHEAVTIKKAGIAARAEREESQRSLAGMPSQVIPVLEELATTPAVTADLSRRCALAEAATRDYLTAPRLVNRALTAQLESAREKCAYVVLSDGGTHTAADELGAVRAAMGVLTGLAQAGSRLTVRWTVGDPDCFATATVTKPLRRSPPVPAEPGRTEVIADADAVQIRFLTPATPA